MLCLIAKVIQMGKTHTHTHTQIHFLKSITLHKTESKRCLRQDRNSLHDLLSMYIVYRTATEQSLVFKRTATAKSGLVNSTFYMITIIEKHTQTDGWMDGWRERGRKRERERERALLHTFNFVLVYVIQTGQQDIKSKNVSYIIFANG